MFEQPEFNNIIKRFLEKGPVVEQVLQEIERRPLGDLLTTLFFLETDAKSRSSYNAVGTYGLIGEILVPDVEAIMRISPLTYPNFYFSTWLTVMLGKNPWGLSAFDVFTSFSHEDLRGDLRIIDYVDDKNQPLKYWKAKTVEFLETSANRWGVKLTKEVIPVRGLNRMRPYWVR